jgi:hypothetical protein
MRNPLMISVHRCLSIRGSIFVFRFECTDVPLAGLAQHPSARFVHQVLGIAEKRFCEPGELNHSFSLT